MSEATPDLASARLRELLDAATPGIWVNIKGSIGVYIEGRRNWSSVALCGEPDREARDCEAAANAELLAASKRLAARVIELERALREARSMLSMVRVTQDEWDADGQPIDGDLERSWSAALARIDAALRARAALDTPNAE